MEKTELVRKNVVKTTLMPREISLKIYCLMAGMLIRTKVEEFAEFVETQFINEIAPWDGCEIERVLYTLLHLLYTRGLDLQRNSIKLSCISLNREILKTLSCQNSPFVVIPISYFSSDFFKQWLKIWLLLRPLDYCYCLPTTIVDVEVLIKLSKISPGKIPKNRDIDYIFVKKNVNKT